MNPQSPHPGQKARDSAAVLPICGILLLVTPLFAVLTKSGTVFGIPALFLFIFGVWAGLIVLGRSLSARLTPDEADDD